MAFLVYNKLVLFASVLLLGNTAYASYARSKYDTALFNRSSFPSGFLFGTASSAYQYEGAAKVDGRGPSIWDTFTHKYPEKIADGSNGDVAIDQYHKYKEDVGIMKEMGLDAYRLSISWPRILPKGTVEGGINRAGIAYYNHLIDELLAHGIKPFVTIFHWDVPQTLEDEYGGFLSSKIVGHFQDFADVCFKEFGDRVKHWITLNEPWTFCDGGYVLGSLAPGRCSAWQQLNCTGGNSATEPYIVGHNLLLAHAAAVKLYRDKYKASQKGVIGITLVTHWFVPYSDAKHNLNAAQRALDFMLGWSLDPITYGDYPHSMRSLVGNRLPKFTEEQSLSLKGSYDFLGLNYYTAFYAAYAPYSVNAQNMSYVTDALTNLTSDRNGIPIGPVAASSWLSVYPSGIRSLLLYVKNKYKNPLIYITENGIDEFNNSTLPLEQQLADPMRIDYYYRHLQYLLKAIKDGVNVKGYFAWSLLDNFEWGSGYTVRFGINYVDYKNGLKRYPKHSSIWFKSFLKKH
ncbi:beta-glucosidase 12 [Eucalyptus grandis]|uniref:Thioglucosidase n=2 Tax=Eucalyptus grandis TaxID=71139 RepID=A0A059D9N5_EUCGR|nr:beta-glucosidase 12 [Eucalyptus grandis]KAK3443545.1 hypothetical protein EUGRSUZ_B03659 [Eucalyptus grandis]